MGRYSPQCVLICNRMKQYFVKRFLFQNTFCLKDAFNICYRYNPYSSSSSYSSSTNYGGSSNSYGGSSYGGSGSYGSYGSASAGSYGAGRLSPALGRPQPGVPPPVPAASSKPSLPNRPAPTIPNRPRTVVTSQAWSWWFVGSWEQTYAGATWVSKNYSFHVKKLS